MFIYFYVKAKFISLNLRGEIFSINKKLMGRLCQRKKHFFILFLSFFP
ncbi:hypothetical protein DB42_DB00210 [Neochlamydia sp. EPS4]|nr:hypothetical protein DB42_DB00210 [Neochlamydia sp. EPS4]